jgi:hypothetical protein
MRGPIKGLFDGPPLEMTSNDVTAYTNISRRENYDRAPLRSALRSWTWDVIALVIVTIALAATIPTLSIRQDRPLPAWLLLISVNALIAIFTAILEAALLVPVASGVSSRLCATPSGEPVEGITKLKWRLVFGPASSSC